MCGKSATTTTNTAPNPIAMQAYENLLGRAGGVSQLPFTPYGGEFVAPLNAQQNLAGSNINQNAGFAMPFIEQGAQYATQAAQPVTAAQIAGYQSPYTQQVVNATEAQFANQNAQQLEQVRGNAAAQGALGGDREAVAEGITAGQQSLAQSPTIAGLYNQGYNTALSTALQEQQQLGQSAYSLGNLGVAGQNAALTGANAQLGFGTLGQSTQQAYDQALYNQFLAQQAFPFQETQWLAGIDTAAGSQMGGTSSTTGPAPSFLAQMLGLGIAGVGAFAPKGSASGGRVDGKIPGFEFGGTPYAGGSSYIPTMGLTMGSGAPKPPGTSSQNNQNIDPLKLASSTIDLEKKIKGLGGGSGMDLSSIGSGPVGDALSDMTGIDPLAGGIFARGGGIPGFAGGGLTDDAGLSDVDPSFIDRFAGSGDNDRAALYSALDGLQRRGDDPAAVRRLGLGDIVQTHSPGFEQNYGFDNSPMSHDEAMRQSGERYAASGQGSKGLTAPIDVPGTVHAPSDNGRYYNLTDGPDAPGGTIKATDFQPLPPDPYQVGSQGQPKQPAEVRSLDVSSYAPVPGTSGAPALSKPEEKKEKTSGFGLLDKLGIHMDPNLRKGLLAAGFGMMASRSPYLGNAVGEGGLAGLAAYTGSEKQQQSVEDARKKLEMHADEFSKKLALETKKQQEAHDYQEKHLEYLKQHSKELLDQGKFSAPMPGMGQNAAGEQVPGAYVTNTKTGEPIFHPNVVLTGKGGSTPLPAQAWNAHGDDFLKYLPPEKQGLVKGMANYEIDPKTLSVVGGHREDALNWAKQYDPNFDQKTYNLRYNAVNKFATGPQGQNITSLNTTMYHLDTLLQAADAMNNGNIRGFNQLRNVMTTQFGYPEVTNFQGVRDIAADEVVKSVLGTAGSDADRQEMRKSILAAGSPAQLHGIIDRYQDMMAGRLHSLRYTFKDATGLGDEAFDRKLTPETRERLGRLEAGVGGHGGGGDPLSQARAAISRGAPRDAVIQRLRQNGIDPTGL